MKPGLAILKQSRFFLEYQGIYSDSFTCQKRLPTLDREGWILYRQRVGKEDGAGRKPVKIEIALIATSQKPEDTHYPFRHHDKKVGMSPSPAHYWVVLQGF